MGTAAGTTPVEAATDVTFDSAAKWHLDPSFGTDGFSFVDPVPGGDPYRWGGDIAVQPDGKIVVASRTKHNGFGLFRLLPDGTLDPAFGEDGFALWPVAEDRGWSITIGLQNVGAQTKILALGQAEIPPLRMWRFNADGSPDDADDADPQVVFGKGGMLEFRPKRPGIGPYPTFSVGPDDSIAVTALDRGRGFRGSLLIRLHRDGARDTDFGPRGIRRIGRTGGHSSVITTTGGHLRIITAGWQRDHGPAWQFKAFTADGTRDETYGVDGRVTVIPPDSPPRCHSQADNRWLRELPDGDLVVAGHPCGADYYTVESAVRLTADGEHDLGFGEGGWASPLDPETPTLWHPTIHSDGSVAWGDNQGRTMFVGGVRPDGRPDPRFGDHGFVKIRLDDPLIDYAKGDGIEYDDQGRILGSFTVDWTDGRSSAILFRLITA